jgi:ADP-glucose pyrophosphorylase
MPDAVIGKNAYIEKAIVPEDIHIPDGAVICGDPISNEIILVTEELIEELLTNKL